MLVVFDMNFILHRTLHLPVYESMETSFGHPTGGLYGSLKSVRKMLYTVGGSSALAVWDGGLSDRRRSMFPEYKKKRREKKKGEKQEYYELFYHQKELVEDMLWCLGVSLLELAGREADDVIGKVLEFTDRCTIVSSDKDLLQLVDGQTDVYCPIKNRRVTSDTFEHFIGIPKDYYLLYKAMRGDSSDGIPGIKGVGEKTAKKVIARLEAPTLESLGRVTRESSRKRWRKIYEGLDVVERNLKLMDVRRESFQNHEISTIRQTLNSRPGFRSAKVAERLSRYELKSLMDDFTRWTRPFSVLV